jgi:hypothetical protein
MSFIGLRPGSKSIVPLICCILVFLKGFGSDVLFGAPINRLLERSICRHYYESHSPGVFSADEEIDEKLCKLGGIQTELALILGTAGFLSPLVGSLPPSLRTISSEFIAYNLSAYWGTSSK